VLRKLQHLKVDKSPGPDGIHPALLKNCASAVTKPLTAIFQESYYSGIVPNDWKIADISPLFKKGSKSDLGNYRPVSLTSVVCKVMESIVRDTVVESFKDEFSCFQHGFMKHRSCLTNILESLEAWTKALDDGYGIDLIYLDYRKAFDTVPHARLIEKLKSLGISGKLLDWIANFLHLRKMRVRVRKVFPNGLSFDWCATRLRLGPPSVPPICQRSSRLDQQQHSNVCGRYKDLVHY